MIIGYIKGIVIKEKLLIDKDNNKTPNKFNKVFYYFININGCGNSKEVEN